MAQKLAIAAVLAALLIVAIPLGMKLMVPPPPEPPPPPPPPPAEPEPVITREEFDQIRVGMEYWDVVDLIGEPEAERDSEYNEGVPGYTAPSVIAWHTWRNENGSWAKVSFIKEKVVEKKCENLPPE